MNRYTIDLYDEDISQTRIGFILVYVETTIEKINRRIVKICAHTEKRALEIAKKEYPGREYYKVKEVELNYKRG